MKIRKWQAAVTKCRTTLRMIGTQLDKKYGPAPVHRGRSNRPAAACRKPAFPAPEPGRGKAIFNPRKAFSSNGDVDSQLAIGSVDLTLELDFYSPQHAMDHGQRIFRIEEI